MYNLSLSIIFSICVRAVLQSITHALMLSCCCIKKIVHMEVHHLVKRNSIESVQKQAIIFSNKDYNYREQNEYVPPAYSERCKKVGLESLVRVRVNASTIFMHKIIMGKYSSTTLRNELDIFWTIRTIRRRPEIISIRISKTDYALNSPFFIGPTISSYVFAEKAKKIAWFSFRRSLQI